MSTLSGFLGAFHALNKRAPTLQEIFDEGVREGKARATPAELAPLRALCGVCGGRRCQRCANTGFESDEPAARATPADHISQARDAVIEECIAACENERLEGDSDCPEDDAYESAIKDCIFALQMLAAKPSAPPEKPTRDAVTPRHITDDEVRNALAEMGLSVSDPMWADHCEITKTSLQRWIKALRGAYCKGYAEAGYDAQERPRTASSEKPTRDAVIEELPNSYMSRSGTSTARHAVIEEVVRECGRHDWIGTDVVDVIRALTAPSYAPQNCGCETCRPITLTDMRMIVCATCGNKRCPHATDHRNACTNSNESGQPGSSYAAPPEKPAGDVSDS